ncbi:MAG: helix-turn-helix transcriptional regulator [Myxococcales bacterium]|nr:helix-turn-helix transcriptional regulator [Myxococcales bacterium]
MVRLLRQERGLALADVAAASRLNGVPMTTSVLSQLERGKRQWTLRYLVAVSFALKVQVADLCLHLYPPRITGLVQAFYDEPDAVEALAIEDLLPVEREGWFRPTHEFFQNYPKFVDETDSGRAMRYLKEASEGLD